MKKNPFLTKGYLSPTYFCDRKDETEKIILAIENSRDLTIISPRRFGKTGLIHHVLFQKRIRKNFNIFYCDIYGVENLAEMTSLLGNIILQVLGKSSKGILRKIQDFFSGISPALTINPLTSQVEVDFNFKSTEQAELTLQQIFGMLEKLDKPSVLVFDEFQQIKKFPEKNTEAILRTYIQELNKVQFIYSGSSKHVLSAMFSHSNRPFYQSTQLMELGKIDPEKYKRFIKNKFTAASIAFDKKDIGFLLQLTRGHTYYVQYLCNRLYEMGESRITENTILEKLSMILLENESYYFGFRNLLTGQQFALLRAIAKEDGVRQPSAQSFINTHKLGTTSTINSAIKSLVKKELIFTEDDKFVVYDVFFSLWLKMYLS